MKVHNNLKSVQYLEVNKFAIKKAIIIIQAVAVVNMVSDLFIDMFLFYNININKYVCVYGGRGWVRSANKKGLKNSNAHVIEKRLTTAWRKRLKVVRLTDFLFLGKMPILINKC